MRLLETQNLSLREFSEQDADFVLRLLNTPLWLTWIGDKNVKSKEDAVQYIRNGPLKSYRENGFGLYVVQEKNTQAAIGMCGLVKRIELDAPDLGFAFLPEHIEKGHGFEISFAFLQYVFEVLKCQKIYGVTLPENVRSVHLLKKLGFFSNAEIVLSTSNQPLMLFEKVFHE
jgi:[ribosomal protein S5]-alanine N-acetyltransferase